MYGLRFGRREGGEVTRILDQLTVIRTTSTNVQSNHHQSGIFGFRVKIAIIYYFCTKNTKFSVGNGATQYTFNQLKASEGKISDADGQICN